MQRTPGTLAGRDSRRRMTASAPHAGAQIRLGACNWDQGAPTGTAEGDEKTTHEATAAVRRLRQQLSVLRRGLLCDLAPVVVLACGGGHCLVEKVLCQIPKAGVMHLSLLLYELFLFSPELVVLNQERISLSQCGWCFSSDPS
ncbi:hypothetical protein NDU88_001265 [Pleurodeles waltl]|uniref:Uncharacterized protein n=1 Tax=Pleurodeles waltl TaxID=8319 RepID=A0AAV7TI98_PLEWA|nr:hypothetical protein NDU88_001265 [Pleurodeles waltl]